MSAFNPGARILASWLGAGWQPATVMEANNVTGLLRVQFDDGREAWISSMNAKASANVPAAPAAPQANATTPSAGSATQAAAKAPPPPGEFKPVSAENPAPVTSPEAFAQTIPGTASNTRAAMTPTVMTPIEPALVQPPPVQPAPAIPAPPSGDFHPIQGESIDPSGTGNTGSGA